MQHAEARHRLQIQHSTACSLHGSTSVHFNSPLNSHIHFYHFNKIKNNNVVFNFLSFRYKMSRKLKHAFKMTLISDVEASVKNVCLPASRFSTRRVCCFSHSHLIWNYISFLLILVSLNKPFEDIRGVGNCDEHHVHLIDWNTIHYLTIQLGW